MSNSEITTVKGSQDIVILPNRTRLDTLDEGIRAVGAFPQDRKYGLMAGHNDTELGRSDGFSQSSLNDRMVTGGGCESSFVNTGGLLYCHPAQTAILPLSHKMIPSYQPQDKKKKRSSRRSSRRNKTNGSRSSSDDEEDLALGNFNFFDENRGGQVFSTDVFRIGIDEDRIHHIRQSAPGSTSSLLPQDPRGLVDDKRNAESRQKGSNARGRDVNMFSRSVDAVVQNTSIHVTDESRGAVELPDSPSPEYIEAAKAIKAISSRRNPVVYMNTSSQPSYVATGNDAPGYHFSYPSTQGYPGQDSSYPQGGHYLPPPNHNTYGRHDPQAQYGPQTYSHTSAAPGSSSQGGHYPSSPNHTGNIYVRHDPRAQYGSQTYSHTSAAPSSSSQGGHYPSLPNHTGNIYGRHDPRAQYGPQTHTRTSPTYPTNYPSQSAGPYYSQYSGQHHRI
ncbi:hypothetical protein K435DRAFT_526884 [Dendrothele bispora CBS 962.96]|uniref:Uncharacterized protein n=1 Tax=Dendrothele bispora (strain CBS 962.96) TaxID=1314807 RepID=A0A4S8M8D4_DENBC|nr:hypothetical protein K435DRAFT_526884 [Dendrothele bispora CBS 962.96]